MELVLDDETDQQVRSQWAALAHAGLPSQARHTGESNRPHITMALTESLTPEVQARLVAVTSALPLPITIGGMVIFGSRRFVLARLAISSRPVLDLQARVTGALDDLVDPHQNFGPGRWTPHVTLARRLTAEQVGTALTALGAASDITGQLVGARKWDITAKEEQWLVGG